MPFKFEETSLPGVIIVTPEVFSDERGFLMETYKSSEFQQGALATSFVQENHSRSSRGTLRGLHYQRPPKAQAKLIRVIAGEIYDVAVDIRKGSATFGKWVGTRLTADEPRMIFVPAWCAHGFCVVSAEAEVIYKMTAEYAPELEGGVRWDDPSLAIPWPTPNPVLSGRDRRWPGLPALR
jgi:dTDP-4-dehydrorhamnose 3,5-epimerase